MNKFEISEGTLTGVLNFLSKQPYAEVKSLFNSLESEIRGQKPRGMAIAPTPIKQPVAKAKVTRSRSTKSKAVVKKKA